MKFNDTTKIVSIVNNDKYFYDFKKDEPSLNSKWTTQQVVQSKFQFNCVSDEVKKIECYDAEMKCILSHYLKDKPAINLKSEKYIDTSYVITGKCDPDKPKCIKFDNELNCVARKTGYFLGTKLKNCLKSIDDCEYYDKVGNCIQCKTSFDFYRNTCFDQAKKNYGVTDAACFNNLKCRWRVYRVFSASA